MDVTVDKLKQMYYDMNLIRRFEEKVDEHSKKGNIPGFIHLSIGQEACQTGVMHALKETDYKFPDHRSHGVCLLAGSPKEKVMAEIFAKKTGLCEGKGGSMHIADVEVGNMGNNAIEGSITASGLGTAYASKYRGEDNVTAVFMGDGTCGRGELHESMNMASNLNVPLIYVLVNNGYAISTKAEEAHAFPEYLSDRAAGYDIPAEVVDGNDVEKVYETMKKAVERARKGEGPSMIELLTYRWQGHFSGDPASYRPEDEVKKWKEEKCPIKNLRNKLEQKDVKPETLDKLEEDALQEVNEMVEFALNSPEPELEDATKYIYAEEYESMKEGK
jgi:pyruvate dehydrogenase E1 component alpha subunit